MMRHNGFMQGLAGGLAAVLLTLGLMAASAPFDILESSPANNDPVSSFPANERTNREVIEDALAAEHDMGDASTNKTARHKFGIGNNAARDAVSNPPDGMLWFNTQGNNGTAPHFQIRVAGAWASAENGRVGMIFANGATSCPAGSVSADGAAISRTTFDVLFASIGTTFGAGDGSTTFNVPTLIGRMMVGPGGTLGLAAGTTTGDADASITISTSNMPVHTHGLTGAVSSAGAHTHDVQHANNTGGGAGSNIAGNDQALTVTQPNAALSDGNHAHGDTFAISNAGSGTAFSILNPVETVGTFCIRT